MAAAAAEASIVPAAKTAANQQKFKELTAKPIHDQVECFLKSFIFELGDDWKKINDLEKAFRKRLADANEGKEDLNPIMAADFLQKNGLERTALQRKEEIKDIDLDNNDRIAFIEYLLLHFKVMVLQTFYKRLDKPCPYDLSKGGIGVVGVGPQLLDQLFTPPVGLDPELEAAIEAFTAQKRAREEKLKDLNAKVALGGVKGMAAQNEIKQMEAADMTDMNRVEITLTAAKKRAAKSSGDVALAKKKQQQEEEERAKREASRNKLKDMASRFESPKP
jgi:hypothetical protein